MGGTGSKLDEERMTKLVNETHCKSSYLSPKTIANDAWICFSYQKGN